MANLSQQRRERMIAFLETLKEQHTDDDSLIALGEIEKELKSKKYGLVWEEHEEAVDIQMKFLYLRKSKKKKFMLTKMVHTIFCLRAIICIVFIYLKRHTEERLTLFILIRHIILEVRISFMTMNLS